MTREEAIQKIKDDLRLHHDYLSGDYRKSLRMAIEALQQPEIIRCKDCVYVSPNTKNGCELIRWRWFDGSEFMGYDDYCSRAERREE